MWQVEVPLGEFYDAIIDAGRGARYLALLTALVREADSTSFYEDISRYWDSLHDVTGPDVLFVLAGPEASAKVHYTMGYPTAVSLWRIHLAGQQSWLPGNGLSARN